MRKKMEEYQGVKWARREEIANLLENGEVEGPFDAQQIVREAGFIRSGVTLCYQEAARIVQDQRYDFAVGRGLTRIYRKSIILDVEDGFLDVEFYRFKRI